MSEGGVEDDEALLVHGSLMMGYAQACRNLKIVVGRDANLYMNGLEINRWYPLSEWKTLEQLVVRHYSEVGPILVKVGMEMMKGWYHAIFRRSSDGSEKVLSIDQLLKKMNDWI